MEAWTMDEMQPKEWNKRNVVSRMEIYFVNWIPFSFDLDDRQFSNTKRFMLHKWIRRNELKVWLNLAMIL